MNQGHVRKKRHPASPENGSDDRFTLPACEKELEKAQSLLVDALRRYTDFFDYAPTGFAKFDPRGIIRDINLTGAALLGVERSELSGRDFGSFVLPDDLQKFRTHLERCTRRPKASTELRLLSADGNIHYVHLASTPFATAGGGNFCLSSLSDIADLKQALEEIEVLNTDLADRKNQLEQANARLQEANAELEAFSFTISHDLRSPLSGIYIATQGLLRHGGDALLPECRAYIGTIQEQAEHINRIVTSLLDFARISREEIRKEAVDLSEAARKIAADLRFNHPGRSVEFIIPDAIVATGDRHLLEVVMENLLGNAWKFTAATEAAVIEFSVTEADGERAFFVRDNGIGFAPMDSERIFDSFQRLQGREEYEGYGIGLGTVQRIVQRHGGRVWGEGKPGVGATFFFTLP